eukprot:CAMPEP_0113826496 /NCGR_PEP_ID=MMETSP0328-20130328/4289_1 /TAXON_ID=39455 /ORGANISM="Alexandrium minutum" /LENGTH=110 /DNA_ID=CAMNT_0000794471 /DNA_START=227 /DNA_END=557 /DNA_ORIENTATION=+ /assembly_acc=CAM_ASM_000350
MAATNARPHANLSKAGAPDGTSEAAFSDSCGRRSPACRRRSSSRAGGGAHRTHAFEPLSVLHASPWVLDFAGLGSKRDAACQQARASRLLVDVGLALKSGAVLLPNRSGD